MAGGEGVFAVELLIAPCATGRTHNSRISFLLDFYNTGEIFGTADLAMEKKILAMEKKQLQCSRPE